MTPGPSEPDAEQMQQYLRIIVDDLGEALSRSEIPTPSCPEGTCSSRNVNTKQGLDIQIIRSACSCVSSRGYRRSSGYGA